MVVWALFRANIFVRVLFRGLFWATFAWALFGALFGEGFRDFWDYETFMVNSPWYKFHYINSPSTTYPETWFNSFSIICPAIRSKECLKHLSIYRYLLEYLIYHLRPYNEMKPISEDKMLDRRRMDNTINSTAEGFPPNFKENSNPKDS